MTTRIFHNRNSTHAYAIENDPTPPSRAPLAFHRKLSGYVPSPLIDAPEIARRLGVGTVLLKNESNRLGLPAFKILGASWAIYRALQNRNGSDFEAWETLEELVQHLVPLRPLTLATATDGNHGRAVARVARLFGFDACIYVPKGTAQARFNAIAGEGATVVVVDGTYDDAVARAAEDAGERCLVISDTSWPGYEEIPRWVMDGYSTILWEIDDELARRDEPGVDLIAVQFGVGALAAAVVNHYRQPRSAEQPAILSVEPTSAACALASIEAGQIVTVPGPHHSIMAGLNCGRPSVIAWPIVSAGMDAFIAVDDERAREVMRLLASVGIVAGETGAAGLAGLLEFLTGTNNAEHRAALGMSETSRVLAFITEGATDPVSYAQIIAG